MKLGRIFPACGVAAALLAGCFSGNPDRPEWRALGEPVAVTSMAALTIDSDGPGEASYRYLSDVAVDPGSGDLVVTIGDEMGYSAAVVKRGTGEVVATVPLEVEATLTTMVGPGRLMLSGFLDHSILDLETGDLSPVDGLEPLAARSFPVMASSPGGDDLSIEEDEEVVTLECEPRRDSPIEVWGGPATNRVLLSSTPLRTRVSSVGDLAYAPDLGVVILATDGRLIAIDLATGVLAYEYTNLPASWIGGLAYDGATGRLLVLDEIEEEVLEYAL